MHLLFYTYVTERMKNFIKLPKAWTIFPSVIYVFIIILFDFVQLCKTQWCLIELPKAWAVFPFVMYVTYKFLFNLNQLCKTHVGIWERISYHPFLIVAEEFLDIYIYIFFALAVPSTIKRGFWKSLKYLF